MRPRIISTLAIVTTFCLALAAFARPDDAAVRKAMMANFDKSIKQYKAKQLIGVMSMYTGELSGEGSDGEAMTKTSVEAEMKQATAATRELQDARLTSGTATVKRDIANRNRTMALNGHLVDKSRELRTQG